MGFVFLAIGALYLCFPVTAWKWGRFSYNSESNASNKDLEKMMPSKKTVKYFRMAGGLLIAISVIIFISF